MLKINEDLLPVASSKSLISNSFVSPRDALLFNFGLNRSNKGHKNGQVSSLQNLGDNNIIIKALPEPEQLPIEDQTNTTTNESYSIEKYACSESLNKDYLYVSSSNGQTLYDNSTERNLQQEDGSSKSQIQTMHIIEYEEFLPKSRPASSYNNLKEASFEETPIERSKKKALTNNFEQVVLNKEESKVKSINGMTNYSPPSPPKGEMSFRKAPVKKKLELRLGDLSDQDDRTKHERRKSHEEKFVKTTASKPHIDVEYNPFISPAARPEEKSDGLTNKYLGFLRRSEDGHFNPSNPNLKEEKDTLNRENKMLKQEVNKIYTDLKELDNENLKLKEEVNVQRNLLVRLQERCGQISGFREFSESDDNAVYQSDGYMKLAEENKKLQENKYEYKHALREKDAQISQLQAQYEEVIRVNQNEILVEKVKEYKEKMTQMAKQIEDQKLIIQAKDNKIESMSAQMKEHLISTSKKDREIVVLRSEISQLKEERSDSQIRCTSPTLDSGKISPELKADLKQAGGLYSKIRDKEIIEKGLNSPEKKPELIDLKYLNSQTSSQASSERKGSRPYINSIISEKNLQKSSFQPVSIHSEKRFNLFEITSKVLSAEDTASKSSNWSTLKWNMLNQRHKVEKSEKEKNESRHQKIKNKSIDISTKLKSEPKKPSQNVEDLQKRLSYLKYKRNEFEKKKGSNAPSKEGSCEISRKTIDSASAGFKTTLRNSDILSSLKNMALNKCTELRKDSLDSKSAPLKNTHKSVHLFQDFNMDEDIKTLGAPLTAKPRLHAKMDNFISNHQQQQAEVDYKLASRYNSFSNTLSGSNRANENNHKTNKKSYDLSSYTKISELRSMTEVNTKNKEVFFS